jgi:hypothetical protein
MNWRQGAYSNYNAKSIGLENVQKLSTLVIKRRMIMVKKKKKQIEREREFIH